MASFKCGCFAHGQRTFSTGTCERAPWLLLLAGRPPSGPQRCSLRGRRQGPAHKTIRPACFLLRCGTQLEAIQALPKHSRPFCLAQALALRSESSRSARSAKEAARGRLQFCCMRALQRSGGACAAGAASSPAAPGGAGSTSPAGPGDASPSHFTRPPPCHAPARRS